MVNMSSGKASGVRAGEDMPLNTVEIGTGNLGIGCSTEMYLTVGKTGQYLQAVDEVFTALGNNHFRISGQRIGIHGSDKNRGRCGFRARHLGVGRVRSATH